MIPGQPMDPQQQQQTFNYHGLQNALFSGEGEKSFVDKLLGRQDADKLHKLMKKDPLEKSDIEEILFLMTSIDQKIVNYDEWDRYVIVKLFPWVKDYSTIIKTWMIYEEQYNKGKFDNDFTYEEEILIEIERDQDQDKYKDKPFLKELSDVVADRKIEKIKKKVKPILEETKTIISEITKYLQHNLKFLISVFLLVSNSTLSIDGAAFETLTTNRFEYAYPNLNLPQPPQKGTIANLLSPRRK